MLPLGTYIEEDPRLPCFDRPLERNHSVLPSSSPGSNSIFVHWGQCQLKLLLDSWLVTEQKGPLYDVCMYLSVNQYEHCHILFDQKIPRYSVSFGLQARSSYIFIHHLFSYNPVKSHVTWSTCHVADRAIRPFRHLAMRRPWGSWGGHLAVDRGSLVSVYGHCIIRIMGQTW